MLRHAKLVKKWHRELRLSGKVERYGCRRTTDGTRRGGPHLHLTNRYDLRKRSRLSREASRTRKKKTAGHNPQRQHKGQESSAFHGGSRGRRCDTGGRGDSKTIKTRDDRSRKKMGDAEPAALPASVLGPGPFREKKLPTRQL